MVAANLNIEPSGFAERDYLSPHEFVAKSGLSLATVRRYLRDGRLPAIQPGGPRCRVLIPASALAGLGSMKQTAEVRNPYRSPNPVNRSFSSDKPLPGPTAKWRRKK